MKRRVIHLDQDERSFEKNLPAAASLADLARRAGISYQTARRIQRCRGVKRLHPPHRIGRSASETIEHEHRLRQLAEHPDWTATQHAKARGISPSRWRAWRTETKQAESHQEPGA